MAKKKASFLCLIVQIFILLIELSLAFSTYELLIVQIASVADFSTFLPTVGATWIGIGILSRILSGIGGWFQLPNVAKNVGWGFIGTLLGGAILLVWLIVAHACAIVRYFFACLFRTDYQVSAPQNVQNDGEAEAEDADEEMDVDERYVRDLKAALYEIDIKKIDSSRYSYRKISIDHCSLEFSFPWTPRSGMGSIDVYAEIIFYCGDKHLLRVNEIEEREREIEGEIADAVDKVLKEVNAQYEYKGKMYPFYTPIAMKYHVSSEMK